MPVQKNMEEARNIIKNYQGPKIRIMEVCGTHTHEIFRLGIRSVLPENIQLISGPGCPVCVSPVNYIDEAVMLALDYGATIMTFGDLLKVPGSSLSLSEARAKGGDIQIVYSPLDAVAYAASHSEKQVVFLGVGFETTAPAICLSVKKAKEGAVNNYSVLTATKTMPRAYEILKGSADAFLYPGHVNAIMGENICHRLKAEGVSGVIAGFTAKELLCALAAILENFQKGEPFFENCYQEVVRAEGNPSARKLMEEIMEPCDAIWRGIGTISGSGLCLRQDYEYYDARKRFKLPVIEGRENPACLCGEVLQGKCKPSDCPVFGKGCTPQHPVGACMVSGEGACSAYYQYNRNE